MPELVTPCIDHASCGGVKIESRGGRINTDLAVLEFLAAVLEFR